MIGTTTQRPQELSPDRTPVRRVQPGERVTAERHNEVIRAAQSSGPLFQAPRQNVATSEQFARLITMEVYDLLPDGDNLLCKPFSNGASSESDGFVTVARPYGLRKSETNGQTIEVPGVGVLSYVWTGLQARTVTRQSDGYVEEQEITESYIPALEDGARVRQGSIIIAMANVVGGTNQRQVVVGRGTQQVALIDSNNQAKAWAAI
mgnify:CR=1 FL=1